MIFIPPILFASIWFFTLYLYSLHLSNLLLPLNNILIVSVILITFSFFVPYLFYWLLPGSKVYDVKRFNRSWFIGKLTGKYGVNRVKKLTFLFIILTVFEILIAGNFPLFSALGLGKELLYVDFGIKGLHGFLNAIFLAISSVVFFTFFLKQRVYNPMLLYLILIWPILLLNRQLMLSLLIQVFFLYIITKNNSFKQLVKYFIIIIVVVVLFGYLGDLRNSREFFMEMASPTFDYPDYLPSGFMWVYIYMTTPINNLNFNIELYDIKALYLPIIETVTLLPSFMRDSYVDFFGSISHHTELVLETFNVSSGLEPFYKDFGVYFSVIPFFFISLASLFFFHNARKSLASFLGLIVILNAVLLSVFVNFFTHIVYIFEIVIYFYLYGDFFRKNDSRQKGC